MPKIFSLFIIVFINKIIFSQTLCSVGENNCSKCNPLTKLCVKCDKDVYTPDKNGGCENSKKCILGNNYCNECTQDESLCKICEEGFVPDNNGGCSYTNNCEISYKGECLKCINDYILVGKENNLNREIKICKSINLEEFKNCLKINTDFGICDKCDENFYLNDGDKKCSNTENCYESTYGKCKICNDGFYLDKNENKCLKQNDKFLKCKETLDGEKCDKCIDNYYFDKKYNCVNTNYCNIGYRNICEECINGYYLSKSDNVCTTEKNCYYGDEELGICLSCIENYAIDFKDGKCKLNTEDNEYKFCLEIDGGCTKCLQGYYLGEDKKCSKVENCAESDNKGNCLVCSENYYLDLDNKCTNIEHCLHSYYGRCLECEKGYYYEIFNKKCLLSKNNFNNCAFGTEEKCLLCNEDFYLNQKDDLCYSNIEKGKFYKCELTDYLGEYCQTCIDNYHIGNLDKKCTNIRGCEMVDNEDKCLECSDTYCLDTKNGICIDNNYILKEEDKIYYRCNKTNEEGNACEICNNGYILNDKGLCVDDSHCFKNEEGVCQKCLPNQGEITYYCLNSEFGCVKTIFDKCLKCDDILDFDKCGVCWENFNLNDHNKCI